MITGEYNNCEKCGASYSTYKIGKEGSDGDYLESWCEIPTGKAINGEFVIKKPKGVCQFCNPKSILYIAK